MEEVTVPTVRGENSTRDKEEEQMKKGGTCTLMHWTRSSSMGMLLYLPMRCVMCSLPPLTHSRSGEEGGAGEAGVRG